MPTAAIRDIDSRRQYWQRNASSWALALLLCLMSLIILLRFGYQTGYERLYLEAKKAAENELAMQTQILESYLEKYRLLPVLLARHSHFMSDIETIDSPRLKTWLQELNYLTGSHDVLLLDRDGTVLQSAHHRSDFYPDFAGNELIVAPLQARLGRDYLFIDNDLQLYGFSASIQFKHQQPLIFVFMVDMSFVKESWALASTTLIAQDDNGQTTLASNDTWIGQPSPADRYLNHPDYAPARHDLKTMGWTIQAFEYVNLLPLKLRTVLSSLLISLTILVAFALFIRRRELHIKQELRDRLYAHELEKQIAFRTTELISANHFLSDEINERKHTEKQLQIKHKELIHSAKLATIGQMSATLSHEYNQPLAAMRTYAENAQRFLEKGRYETVSENLLRIEQQTDRLAKLTRTLMSFAGKPNQPMTAIELDVAVNEALMLLQPRLTKLAIVVTKNMDRQLKIRAHAVQVSQVLLNLLSNAIDAISDSNNAAGCIRLTTQAEEKTVCIRVEDNGPGVDEQIENSLFDPFVSTKTNSKGLGLGLSIVRDIIHDHQGTLSVSRSELGGACFTIHWPRYLHKDLPV